MTGLHQWLRQLLVHDRPDGPPEDDDGLTAWLSVAGAPGPDVTTDLALDAPTPERAEQMLLALLHLGTVCRVWIAIDDDAPATDVRRLERLARRLRPLGLYVERALLREPAP